MSTVALKQSSPKWGHTPPGVLEDKLPGYRKKIIEILSIYF